MADKQFEEDRYFPGATIGTSLPTFGQGAPKSFGFSGGSPVVDLRAVEQMILGSHNAAANVGSPATTGFPLGTTLNGGSPYNANGYQAKFRPTPSTNRLAPSTLATVDATEGFAPGFGARRELAAYNGSFPKLRSEFDPQQAAAYTGRFKPTSMLAAVLASMADGGVTVGDPQWEELDPPGSNRPPSSTKRRGSGTASIRVPGTSLGGRRGAFAQDGMWRMPNAVGDGSVAVGRAPSAGMTRAQSYDAKATPARMSQEYGGSMNSQERSTYTNAQQEAAQVLSLTRG